jgi:hypothetical protein
MVSSRTWPRPEVEEERHKEELPLDHHVHRFIQVTGSAYTHTRVPVRRAAPSPYIGERVAYSARNPNGIFD